MTNDKNGDDRSPPHAQSPEGEARPKDITIRTIADLAQLAGVSTGTVSRALAGKSLVNEKTRTRIQALADEHGFRPNQMASRLRSRRTGVVGVVIPLGHDQRQRISDPFFLTLLGSLADELNENGYDLMLSRKIPNGRTDWLEHIARSGMVDGVIVIGQSDQFDVIEEVAAGYHPMVVWGHNRDGQKQCTVGSDNELGGRMAVEHLIAGGARNIMFLGATGGIETARRLDGARLAADKAGVGLCDVPIHYAAQDMEERIVEALTADGSTVDAIFAASDLIALTTVGVLRKLGRSVPQDVQVIGFDDVAIAAYASPSLSTIRQEVVAGAKVMVDKLRRRMAGETTRSLVIAPQLIVRETTRN